MATEAVLKYLQDTNRPYSANDIVQNMHKEYSKTQIQKSLDELVADGSIIEKMYGKQKVYCIKQNENVEDSDEELTELNAKEKELTGIVSNIVRNLDSAEKSMKSIYNKLNKKKKAFDQEKLKEIEDQLNVIMELLKSRKINDCRPESIASMTELLTNLKNELSTTESSLKVLLSEPTTEEALKEVNQLKNSNTKMSEKIDLLKKSTNLIPEKEKTAINKAKTINLNEFKKRKRLCISVINEILENYPKSKKVLLEEIGIDQDGDQILEQIQN